MFKITTLNQQLKVKELRNSNTERIKGYKICQKKKNVNNRLRVFRRLEKGIGNNKNMG